MQSDDDYEIVALEWFPDGMSGGKFSLNDLIAKGAKIKQDKLPYSVRTALCILNDPFMNYSNDLMPEQLRESIIKAKLYLDEMIIESDMDDETIELKEQPILAHYKMPKIENDEDENDRDYYIVEGFACKGRDDMMLMAFSRAFGEEQGYYGGILLSQLDSMYAMRQVNYIGIVDDLIRLGYGSDNWL